MSRTLPLRDGVKADASLSPCSTYRYALTRDWFPKDRGHVLWIMLNPSVADADLDDPTLRRCQDFAIAWGYDGVTVANLFALRSPYPDDLITHSDPVGPANDDVLEALIGAAGVGLVVAGWGVNASAYPRRVQTVTAMAYKAGRTLHAVDKTKGGYPRHPLYIKGDKEPVVFRDAPSDAAEGDVALPNWPEGA